MRFFHSPGGASPRSVVIADTTSCWSRGLMFPRIEVRTPRRIPPTCSSMCCHIFGFASPRSLPPRTFNSFQSATVAMRPFPASPLLPYRKDVVPRGVAPQAGPYHRASYEDVRWPTLPGPCSPSKFPSGHSFRSDRAPMMPCITVAPRLHTVAIAFVPSVLAHDRSWSMRRAPCRVQFLCARDPSFLGNPTYSSSGCVLLRGCRAGWSRRRRFVRCCHRRNFGIAESRPVSFSRTDRRASLLVWCSFGHHRWRPPRGGRPKSDAHRGGYVTSRGHHFVDSLRFR